MASMSNSLVIVLAVLANIVSVVGIVIWNKYITEVDQFNFMVFLSFLHFLFTTIMMRVLLYLGVFTYAPAPLSSVFPVAMWSCLSVGFMNLNLQHNSVGFYQLSKLACIPVTLLVQYLMYSQVVSTNIKLTLIPITFGVGYATVYDLDVNFTGLVFATCAVVATALAQIFTNTYQKSLDCDAMQLLYHTSPIIATGMLAMSPMFDDLRKLRDFEFTDRCKVNIAISCIFALGVNISNYMVLGKTSPLTYQVLGHMKTICIIVLGIVVFLKPVDYRNVAGVAVAMAGVVAYTEIRRRQGTPSPISTEIRRRQGTASPINKATAEADVESK